GRDQPVCGSSNEGNNTLVVYRSPVTGAESTAGVQFAPGFAVTTGLLDPCAEGIMGNVEVSPTSHNIFVVHDSAFLDAIAVARCSNVSFLIDPRGLSCVDLPVASFPGFKTAGNFPNLAIDRSGNLYAVWEQAPVEAATGYITGDTVLKYSYSTDDGSHWSTPITIPTPGLHNNVYAWPAAGDDGRVDIAWYGTTATANPNDPTCGPGAPPNPNNPTTGTPLGGPDAVTSGTWSVYMVQTLNAHAATPTFTPPILASQHYVHKGGLQTIIGGLCGPRNLGDFLQMRIGSKGEAQIAYADSNSVAGGLLATHGMYVRQNGGMGLFSSGPAPAGDPILINAATDPSGDGRFDALGTQGASNLANLDILDSSMAKPDPANCHPAGTPCYRVKMTINDLTSVAPPAGLPASDTDLVWLTQWLVPASESCTETTLQSACQTGGKNFFVYAESYQGADATCYLGETATAPSGAAVGPMLTYPGYPQITAQGACSVVRGAPGTITIDVPLAQVSLLPSAEPLDQTLYSVTASTMTQAQATSPFPPFVGVGGIPFNLIDVARAYNANFPSADLSLTKTDSPDPVLAGQLLTYTLTVANAGPQAATGVVLTDGLPSGPTFVSASTSQGTCSGTATISCNLGTISSGSTAAVTIKTRPAAAGSIVNQATVTASERDPNSADNTAVATTTVNPSADLSVTQTDSPDPAHTGQNLTYTITVGNSGSAATGVTLNDNLPKNAGFGSAATTRGSCSAKPERRIVTCSLGDLPGGSTATVTIVVKPTSKGTITNSASVTAVSPPDPNTANNSSSESTTVQP
ncbi:MAG: DUF11 domain-containing protein, partial [Actinomycetota bacterium]|nr:DUF11 domain-containing protein [Actinomycetota bacterium]